MILASLSQASFHIEATIIHPDSFIARINRLPYKNTDLSNPFKKTFRFLIARMRLFHSTLKKRKVFNMSMYNIKSLENRKIVQNYNNNATLSRSI